MENLKMNIYKFILNTPPYAHPVLNPFKEQSRAYWLKKRYDEDENYIEIY